MKTLTGKVLVADDEQSIRWVLREALRAEGHEVEEADTGAVALERLESEPYDLAVVDIKMPDLDGLSLLSRLREEGRDTPIIIITAQNTMANAIEAMKRGAFDYVTKPFDVEEVQLLVQRVLETQRQTRKLSHLEREARRRFELGVELVGQTPAMQEIFKTIGRVAQTDATVLIQGESGTGKELIARAIHSHSRRWAGPFVALNCSAIPGELLESELFGHERGAFTGATEQRLGVFETAHDGSLFLDEIGDMPLTLQAKLLRVVQEKELTRVGGQEVVPVDCRLIAATNQQLEAAVKKGRFREDLYFRLNVVPISVPPLRERRSDIDELISYFVDKINREMHTRITGVAPETRTLLETHPWPGNVRELENTLVRAAVLAPGPVLMPEDLALARAETGTVSTPDDRTLDDVLRTKLKDFFAPEAGIESGQLHRRVIERVEKPLIELALERTNGNQLRAARLLGINRNTLHKKITELNIDPKRSSDTEH